MPRRVPARRLKEALAWTKAPVRPRLRNSAASKVRANQPRSSTIRSSSMTQAPGSGDSLNLMVPRSGAATAGGGASRQQPELRRPGGEPAPPLADEAELLDDLVLEVPGKDEDDVGAVLAGRPRGAA